MKYSDVILHIEKMILEGNLASGSKLPSVRILALELGCSKTTVLKGYDELVKNKMAYVIDKTGYYLMNDPHERLISDKVGFSIDESVRRFRKKDIRLALNEGLNLYKMDKFDIEGYHPLRDRLKKYFKTRKIFTGVNELVMMPSIKQAVQGIIACTKHETILIEDPVDHSLVNMFKRKKNIRLFNPLELDFDLLELQIIKDKVGLMIITPHMHLPTGRSMTLEDKVKLLNICQNNNVMIVELNQYEDAFDYEESQSLYAIDQYEIVFHIKTFDKVWHESIKDVAVVVPKGYEDRLVIYKNMYLDETSIYSQLCLYSLINTEFGFEYRQNIKMKADIIKSYIDQLDYEYYMADSNNFIFVHVPYEFNLETVVVELKNKNIHIERISDYFIGRHYIKGFVISVTHIDTNKLHQSLQVIIEYMKK